MNELRNYPILFSVAGAVVSANNGVMRKVQHLAISPILGSSNLHIT